MRGTLLLAALALTCQTAFATATGVPVVDTEIEAALKTLDHRVEAQTLAKMQDIFERHVVWVTQIVARDSSH